MVLQGIKDHIFDDASQYVTRWLAKLPHVIWGLRTQVSSATRYSPFFLVYGSEAVLPTDLAFGARASSTTRNKERPKKRARSTLKASRNTSWPC
jgi:hypothetical protein